VGVTAFPQSAHASIGPRLVAGAKLLRDPLAWLVILFGVVLILGPLIATHDPVDPDILNKLAPPSATHFFGTDSLGMDVFSRVLYATRADFAAAIAAVGLAVIVGLPLGIISGFVGGVVDDLINRIAEGIQALPQFLFGMAVLALIGTGLVNMIFVIAFFTVPGYLKLARSMVLGLRQSDFLLAARCAGATTPGIVFRHLLPNTVAPFFGLFAISCALTIQIIAGLSFLGLGVKVPQPEWGSMINQGAPYIITGQWWPAVFPICAIALAVVTLRGLGERLRRRYAQELM
jgi:peptide/nickel transport system permease protein